MDKKLVARATATVSAPVAKVWDALVNPALIKEYMFGADTVSDWKQGSPIVWKGEWQGKKFEDKGVILRFEPQRMLQYSHFSPLAGLPEKPENYHTVTIELAGEGQRTHIALSQDNNSTEKSRQQSQKNWEMMLGGLKKLLDR